MTSDLIAQLVALPRDWAYVAVDGSKRAYQLDWQSKPITRAALGREIKAGRAKAVGVIAGPPSGGLLFVDHDGLSATAELERLGVPLRDLPSTIAFTSGRDGRFQLAYHVPAEHWPSMRGRRVFKTGAIDADGKAENLDLRWAGHYSVFIGDHPQTTGYRWLPGRSPAEQPLAQAPLELIRLMFNQPTPSAPLLTPQQVTGATLPLLDFISRDSRDLIESGGTPGCWNDDHLRLSLDLIGTEAWIITQGHHPDQSARDAFAQHISNARSKSSDFDDRKAWKRFDGAPSHNPTPATPVDKLESRLAYHTRTPRPPRPPNTAKAPPISDKPIKLEAIEILILLRKQAADGNIRWNTFTQSIEIEGAVFDGAERFYLTLAEQGFKVSKELALDCLIQIARENPYDPVTEYLDHVAATIEPAYINGLATAYLRPEDATAGAPTLYDHMLRCTLIGAVRRAFEPGSKHDFACVLMGDQGARKSSFWAALGGPFYSDALGDISSKDDLMVLHRSWIMEWAELDHIMGRRHAGQVKAFLSQSTDMFRVPYGKATESFPRRGIIVGSTNRTNGFLVDDTGNRRFWVIPTAKTEVDPIDTPSLAAERDAIWSAAVHAYRTGDASHLPAELALKVTEENEAYQLQNPWKVPIQHWLNDAGNRLKPITTELLLTEAIAKPVERQTRSDQMQVGTILRELGYAKRKQRAGSELKWVWFLP